MSSGEDSISLAFKGETKARKALSKLNLKLIPNFNRVVIKRTKGGLVVIPNAEIYKSATSDCYVVYGASHLEDPQAAYAQQQQQLALAQQQAQLVAQAELVAQQAAAATTDSAGATITEEDEDEEEEDSEGVKEEDITVVMGQTSCTRNKAVKALKANGGDLLAAIMAI